MSNFIEELFFGNIETQNQSITKSKEFKKVWDKLSANEDIFSHQLTDDEKKLFNEYVECYARAFAMSEVAAFVTGFRIGAKLTLDTFSNTDDLLFT